MPTPHINAEDGAFAKTVLMPGDPKRATWIAENFLVDAKLVTDVRGILGYTGYTKNGKRVSVMASGMGLPSIGIYSYELFTHYGVESIIRIGTCGAYQPGINLFDVIIGQSASTDSDWAQQFNLRGGTFSAIADFDMILAAYSAVVRRGLDVHVGNILSSDIFYDFDPDFWKSWAKLGILGVEMESYALYTTAARLKKRALCILTVTDLFLDSSKKATPKERETGVATMVDIALEIADK